MIKIIKHGTRDIRECDNCGCLFSFDKEDVQIKNPGDTRKTSYIICPQCEHEVNLVSTKEWCNTCKHHNKNKDICDKCERMKYWEEKEENTDENICC